MDACWVEERKLIAYLCDDCREELQQCRNAREGFWCKAPLVPFTKRPLSMTPSMLESLKNDSGQV